MCPNVTLGSSDPIIVKGKTLGYLLRIDHGKPSEETISLSEALGAKRGWARDQLYTHTRVAIIFAGYVPASLKLPEADETFFVQDCDIEGDLVVKNHASVSGSLAVRDSVSVGGCLDVSSYLSVGKSLSARFVRAFEIVCKGDLSVEKEVASDTSIAARSILTLGSKNKGKRSKRVRVWVERRMQPKTEGEDPMLSHFRGIRYTSKFEAEAMGNAEVQKVKVGEIKLPVVWWR